MYVENIELVFRGLFTIFLLGTTTMQDGGNRKRNNANKHFK